MIHEKGMEFSPIKLFEVSYEDYDRYINTEDYDNKGLTIEWRHGALYVVDLPSLKHGLTVNHFEARLEMHPLGQLLRLKLKLDG
jgi:hypothetical protein